MKIVILKIFLMIVAMKIFVQKIFSKKIFLTIAVLMGAKLLYFLADIRIACQHFIDGHDHLRAG